MRTIAKQITIMIAVSMLSFVFFASPNLMAAESAPKTKPLPAKQAQPQTAVKTTTGNTPFDHTRTGFILRDIHTTLRCEQCHVGEIFKGTSKECSGCHSIGSRVAATPKPINHVVTNAACDTCHVTPTSFLVSSFNHIGVVDRCSSCHNGQSLGVVSKPATHFPTFRPCESCHTNTIIFAVARMDHTGITTNCTTCHTGSFPNIVSKPSAHISTTGGCEACHNTITFAGAIYGHVLATVQNNCISCHGGPMPGIVGRPSNHLPTSGAQCDTCHTQTNTGNFTTFLGAVYTHAAGTNCSSCHNGSVTGAFSKPANHVTTSAQCDTCHTTTPDRTANFTTWGGAYYDHTTVVAGQCVTCHNGTSAKGKPTGHIPASNTCDSAGCHNQGTYITFLGATFDHVANLSIVTGKCSTCHGGAYPGVKSKPAKHIATSAQCDTCHTPSNTLTYTTFTGAIPDHSAYNSATNCETCHNGSTAVGKTGGHIPTTGLTSTGTCGLCHAKYSASATTFYPGTMDHTQITSARCDSCHNGGYSSQGIAGGAQPKVSNHIPTTITGALDCTTCHNITKTANSSGMSWAAPMTMNHNGALGMGAPIYCVTCHLTGNSYLGNMRKFSHNGASTAKDCSKSSCHRPVGNTGTSYIRWTN